jgi:hypothetical protein
LPHKEPQPIVISLEQYLASLWEKEHIALLALDLLARLVGDVEVAFDNNLDLVVRVCVFERSAFF